MRDSREGDDAATADDPGDHRPLIAVTMGDPAGIGSEVIVKAHPELRDRADIVVIGDVDVLRDAIRVCDSGLEVRVVDDFEAVRSESRAAAGSENDATGAGAIPVLDLDNVNDHAYGELRETFGRASLAYVERAVVGCVDGSLDAMVTAPINKQATRMAGSKYAGHTGMLADYTDTEDYSMMLVEDDLRVTHVSTHVPLREACDLVSEERVRTTIGVTDTALRDLGVDDPRIAVAGLNPHASDGGLLGDEDDAAIAPAVESARADGIDAIGPESPDTVYAAAAAGDYDCVVSMYHDQGHIPIKLLGFEQTGGVSGVNATVGLPIIRTSVDHGTAFDIAGEGVASPTSMVDAVDVAVRMARNRSRSG
ncbi:4-hydroxythreonine-4-phosphate dehydrogenase PdxA [Halococcus salifodinae]|uniref:4-hydroxythreonine-4-phosphate dehydrogenase n=1 Tax=Halococcus salifodinae DSM 8989 TaxID=1227456 RepID=M0MR26_9EURY|nr:4-hydroxythreonine-4-phosphate dehydrogenase PdxA [Halococcus salifodinae]EMA48177.1 4-hydroxythreonine-4-phosphate dehydrogenase [Halococcus salifodinae DSM 8989]